tara:strand:+ start:2088 stop:2753 length:666 start_codon:yes stop_codon:yes gene_type:complete
MNFKKNKYEIIKKVINKDVADISYKYLLLKKNVAKIFFDTKYISPYEEMFGTWSDTQVANTYSIYGDVLMEVLLKEIKLIMEKITGLELIETYAYARVYKKGDVLHRHKDRFSCEISTTLNLGGNEWPIYIENKKNVGVPDDKKGITVASSSKGIKVILQPGDMLVYRGNILEHWRDAFEGESCGQVFLHYNNLKTKKTLENKYDSRPHLGLPSSFKQRND